RAEQECGDRQRLDRAVLAHRGVRERRRGEAAERAVRRGALQLQELRHDLRREMPAEAHRADVVIGEVEAIVEVAVHRPALDMQLVSAEPRIPGALHGEVRHVIEADIIGVVEEAAARPGEVDQQVRIEHALRPDRGRADQRRVAAEERGLRIFRRDGELEFGPDILPDADAGLPRREEAGHR
ncbi:hypothetical protein chiPu_0033048, partial [Chiloscyllium punctatum]|nr:hypothetical protein [Chiloscyllium punctatum]